LISFYTFLVASDFSLFLSSRLKRQKIAGCRGPGHRKGH
jgi:hypothetical protein